MAVTNMEAHENGWSYFRDSIEQRCVIAEKCKFGQFGIPLRLERIIKNSTSHSDYPAWLNYIITLILCKLNMYIIWRYLEEGERLFFIFPPVYGLSLTSEAEGDGFFRSPPELRIAFQQ